MLKKHNLEQQIIAHALFRNFLIQPLHHVEIQPSHNPGNIRGFEN